MTKTYQWLVKMLPSWLAYIILYLWYSGLLFLTLVFSDSAPVNFIYWGH